MYDKSRDNSRSSYRSKLYFRSECKRNHNKGEIYKDHLIIVKIKSIFKEESISEES